MCILPDTPSPFHPSPQEAKLSQEQLADQVVKTSEEKFGLIKDREAAQKVEFEPTVAASHYNIRCAV